MKNTLTYLFFLLFLNSVLFISGCKKDDPTKEDVPELITKATITFTPNSSSPGSVVVVTATDPDFNGAQDIKVDGAINLTIGAVYTLTVQLVNEVYEITDERYDISKEIEKQGAEHQFFFSWTGELFLNPLGDGNIDNRNDPLNYGASLDKNGRPLGITTTWTTSPVASTENNSFRILLKHQPDLKSNTSTSDDGESDLDLTFTISVN